jgi:hypothetical protein
MKLQVKFKTVPVFHWNDQSELDEQEVMKRVEERRSNMEFHWDELTWHVEVLSELVSDSPISKYLVSGTLDNESYTGSGDVIDISVTYNFETTGNKSELTSKLGETAECLLELLTYHLPFVDLGLDTGILSNPDENGDEVKVGVTCDPNNTQCTIEIVEE